jgi:hypothetical protein
VVGRNADAGCIVSTSAPTTVSRKVLKSPSRTSVVITQASHVTLMDSQALASLVVPYGKPKTLPPGVGLEPWQSLGLSS